MHTQINSNKAARWISSVTTKSVVYLMKRSIHNLESDAVLLNCWTSSPPNNPPPDGFVESISELVASKKHQPASHLLHVSQTELIKGRRKGKNWQYPFGKRKTIMYWLVKTTLLKRTMVFMVLLKYWLTWFLIMKLSWCKGILI